ncbi:GTP cyclohydrolase I FolE [Actinoplanes sp. NPDC051411]|uniref:GTP cyclohydrolase I n=1 Tax=Actinoplanes sp. NPDC051411 TaxID=3155522 RepID=UPI0034281C0F
MSTTYPDLDHRAAVVSAGGGQIDAAAAQEAVAALLRALGVDQATEIAARTPARAATGLIELLSAPSWEFTTFPNVEGHHELVLEQDIAFTSVCAHHLLPFSGHAHVGIYPGKRLAGLSKIARAVTTFAAGLQVQEELGQQLAGFLEQHLECLGVGVVLQAEHLCMTRRGAQAAGTRTTTIATRGRLRTDAAARAELLTLITAGRTA